MAKRLLQAAIVLLLVAALVLAGRAVLDRVGRTATVTALSPLRLAVAARESLDLGKLRALAESHRREDQA